jgi:hypothetical protein
MQDSSCSRGLAAPDRSDVRKGRATGGSDTNPLSISRDVSSILPEDYDNTQTLLGATEGETTEAAAIDPGASEDYIRWYLALQGKRWLRLMCLVLVFLRIQTT